MLIQVKQEHIDLARKLLPAQRSLANQVLDHEYGCCCPVALAIKEATGRKVWVSKEYIHFSGPPWVGPIALIPYEVVGFIKRFDARGQMEPFEFELEIP